MRPWVPDAVAAGALLVVGVVLRWPALPTDGLLFDDAWVAVGAAKAPYDDLLTVSTNHPGFTAMLMTWHRLGPDRSELFAVPAFLAGLATAPLCYAVLRHLRVLRGVAFAAGVLLAVSPVHIRYSGRVKPYVLEGVVALAIVVVTPRLARARWSWRTGVGWVVGAVLLGTLSAFTLVLTAVAAFVLLVHGRRDHVVRAAAVTVQGAAQAVYLATVQGTFASRQVAENWETTYDGYIELDEGARAVGGQLVTHTARLGQTLFAPAPEAAAFALVLLAVLGLAVAARRGDQALAARVLLPLPAVALVGSLLRQVPYGPIVGSPVFPGGRAEIWLLPALAVGLALLADRLVRRWVPERARVVAEAALVLVGGGIVVDAMTDRETSRYALSGARSSHEFIAARADPEDVVVILPSGVLPYAAEPGVDVAIVPDVDHLNGFTARLVDPRLVDGTGATSASVRRRFLAADEVFIHNGLPGFYDAGLEGLEGELAGLGFEPRAEHSFGVMTVTVLGRARP